jgi:hypothetical protein
MIRIARFAYLAFAWLFVIGVVTQVFLAGMVVVARQISWNYHAGLGHLLGFPILLMLISMYLARLPGSMKKMTWALLGVFLLQAEVLIFLREQAPVLSAFHPVMALVDFALGLSLARRAWPLAQHSKAPVSMPVGLEKSANH